MLNKILSDFVNGRKTENIGFDLEKIADLAVKQSVAPIVLRQCTDFLQDGIKDELYHSYNFCLYNYAKQTEAENKIREIFTKEKIGFVFFKGVKIREYYPEPCLRTMSDVDFLIEENKKEKADKLLSENGFKSLSKGDREWSYNYCGVTLELHFKLVHNKEVNTKEIFDFSNAVGNYLKGDKGAESTLDVNYHFVFLIIHLRKHLMYSGVGIRQFLDLALMVKNEELDFEIIENMLLKVGLSEFAKKVLTLCSIWFDTKMPFSYELSEEFVNYALATVYSGGVYGNLKSSKAETEINKAIKNGRLSLFMFSAFPSYQRMIQSGKYPFLNGKPYLLPAFWVYRIVRKSGNIKSVTERIPKKNEVKEKKETLKKWSL